MENNNYCYIHIPFCNKKCSYCRFASLGVSQKLKIATYVHSLCEEIKNPPVFYNKGIFPVPLSSVYFWGGTPGVLELSQIDQILSTLQEKFIFKENIEISIETTPDNVTDSNIQWWKKLGINRVSMGIQTLNPDSLEEIKRGNKWDIFQALQNLENHNFQNVSVDFIIWLPHVKKWEIKKNIQEVLSRFSCIKHVSVYLLEEYYSPDKIIETKYDNITYPENWDSMWLQEEEYLWEYIEVKNFLESQKFIGYEISNYWKKWFECKHNQAYWSHQNIYSFWLWAYWFLDSMRYRNSESFSDYYKREKIITEKNSAFDMFLEKIMFLLRTTGIPEEYLSELDNEKINYFIKNNYLVKKNQTLQLENKWVLVMDYILSEIV